MLMGRTLAFLASASKNTEADQIPIANIITYLSKKSQEKVKNLEVVSPRLLPNDHFSGCREIVCC